jgi:hypothetical protein
MSESFVRRLLHRWLIEYNPLYLLSAALTLGGVNLISKGFTAEGNLYQALGGAALAELYAWALIAGAAVLVRIQLRRPAVMLALLTALYQADVTIHTETCVYLDHVGDVGLVVWLGSFVAKLYALAWAMRLRVPHSVLAIPIVGGLGLAFIPRMLPVLSVRGSTALVALWLFGLVAAVLWSSPRVTARDALDDWGRTVLRRSLRAIWLMWGVFAVFHLLFWRTNYAFDLRVLLPIGLLLVTRWMQREIHVWSTALATLALVALALPSLFAITATLTAITLLLWAYRHPAREASASTPASHGPYREPLPHAPLAAHVCMVSASVSAAQRLLTGALFSAYLGIWTLGWSGGPFPQHIFALDLFVSAIVLGLVWRARMRVALGPLGLSYVHWVLQARIIPAPQSILEWGAVSVGSGFALLLGSIVASYFLRHRLADANRRLAAEPSD